MSHTKNRGIADVETKLYSELAEWWPLMSTPSEYEEEAGFYTEILREACAPRTVMELGSGGGNNESHMKAHFELTLVDRSAEMLAVSSELNPECEHVQGDMCDVRLGKVFDAVFVHDAVCYMTSPADLARLIETTNVHCRPGGAVLFCPDWFRETFEPVTSHGGHDGPERSFRYLEWDCEPAPGEDTYRTDFAFLLRESGKVRVVHDMHVFGLFPRERWLELCRGSGLEPELRKVFHTGGNREGSELILCRKPA